MGKVRFDLTGMKNLQKLRKGGTHTRKAMDVIGTLYLAFTRKRFQKFSGGGGDWAKLDPATVRAKDSNVILKDTGLMFNALTPGAKGSLKQLKGNKRIRVGYSATSHEAGSPVTFQDLANFHDQGAGDLPKRTIFVEPDQPTRGRMRTALMHMIENQVRG